MFGFLFLFHPVILSLVRSFARLAGWFISILFLVLLFLLLRALILNRSFVVQAERHIALCVMLQIVLMNSLIASAFFN